MKQRLTNIVIAINVAGLAFISGLESWRPGIISVAINLGVVWVIAVILISLALLNKETQTPAV